MDWEKDMEHDSDEIERDLSDMEHDSGDRENDLSDMEDGSTDVSNSNDRENDLSDMEDGWTDVSDSEDRENDLSDMEDDSTEVSDSYCGDSRSYGDCGYEFKRLKSDRLQLKNNYLKGIANVLQELNGGTIHFFFEDELCCTDINMEVKGIGQLSFPLKDDSIEKLISISTKARFAKGEEIILNEDFRGIRKITSKKLTVEINKISFTRMLDKMRSEMGFSNDSVLETELHNMLIYSQGQVFDHQDSEKAENMVGTLVVILPTPHIGGDLVIQHGVKEHSFYSENLTEKNFKCIGFYADCKYEIETVKEGIRIALTYKLMLNTKKNTEIEPVNEKLKEAIQNYFANLQTDSAKIVYFLDHIYSEHSLKWNMIKGGDCSRGNALLAVAKNLGLTPYLALVEVKHSWFNRDVDEMEDPIPIEFKKGKYTLSRWVNSNNELQLFEKYFVYQKEICWTKETSASFDPYKSDSRFHAGHDVDFWYKRAAVILWPASSDVVMKFSLNPKGALKELQVTMESAGKENEVKEIVKKCGKELYSKCKNEKSDFEEMVQIALFIKDKEMSMPILSHFKWIILNCDISESLAKLESQFGDVWCVDLLNKWKSNEVELYCRWYTNKIYILKNLNYIVEKYINRGGTSKVVKIILDEQFRKISAIKKFEHHNLGKVREALMEYVEVLYEFVISCTLIENTELIVKITQSLVSSSPLSLNAYLADLYMKLRKGIPANYLASCEPLMIYLISSTQAELAW